jgi:4-hydroxybenzoyl-CoA thioesterase
VGSGEGIVGGYTAWMQPFRTTLIVRFGDVDSAGIVYYPRYPHYLHVGMERFFQEVLGKDYADLTVGQKFGLPTVRLEVDFRSPLRYGDRVEMEIEVGKIGTTSIEWIYRLRRESDGELAATARTVTVATNLEVLEKVEVPDWLRKGLGGRNGDGHNESPFSS